MIDHITLRVKDLARSKEFYVKALAPIGYKVMMEFPEAVGMGKDDADFWIMETDKDVEHHVAFSGTREQVKAFHEAALAAGAMDNGGPGPRPEYSGDYYAAYVHDPDGNNIEVVSHEPV